MVDKKSKVQGEGGTMRTEYEYIYFSRAGIKQNPKTEVWGCYNARSHSRLGVVKWYGPWRQYSFYPDAITVYNSGCLGDIQDFISQLMRDRKVPKGEDDDGEDDGRIVG